MNIAKEEKMKKVMKRMVSLWLIAVMVVSMLPSALGSALELPEDANVVDPGGEEVLEDGKLAISKTVKAAINPDTGRSAHEVTLKVTTTDSTAFEEVIIPQDAAIVLVLDVSGSMNDKIVAMKQAAEKFVKGFTDTQKNPVGSASGKRGKRQVSIVQYNQHATLVSDWLECNDGPEGQNAQTIIRKIYAMGYSGLTGVEPGLWYADYLLAQDAVKDLENKFVILLTDGFANASVPENKIPENKIPDNKIPVNNTIKGVYNNGLEPGAEEFKYYPAVSNIASVESVEPVIKNSVLEAKEPYKWVLNPTGAAHSIRNNRNATIYTIGLDVGAEAGSPVDPNVPKGPQDPKRLGYQTKNLKEWLGYFSGGSGKLGMPGYDSGMDHYFDAEIGDIEFVFDTILKKIVTSVRAWTVTDPMGELIDLIDIEGEDAFVPGADYSGVAVDFDAARNTLTWRINSEPNNSDRVVKGVDSGGNTTYTYTLKYYVNLDTMDRSFSEAKVMDCEEVLTNNDPANCTCDPNTVAYFTNKHTYLDYEMTENDIGQGKKQAHFKVPQIMGEAPNGGYIVKYYVLDKTSKQYEEILELGGSVKCWTKVNVDDIAPNYKDRFLSMNYSFSHLTPGASTADGTVEGEMLIKPNDENVMRLYYDPIPANPVTKHYVKEVIKGVNGDDTVVEHPDKEQDEDGYYLHSTETETGKYVGDTYTFNKLDDTEGYTFERVKDNLVLIDVVLSANDLRELYYVKTIDNRVKTAATVDHKYTINSYELKDGTYVPSTLVEFDGSRDTYSEMFVTQSFTIPIKKDVSGTNNPLNVPFKVTSITGPQDVTIPGINPDDKYDVKLGQSNPNAFVVNYVGEYDNRGDIQDVTVNHYYTETTVTNPSPNWDGATPVVVSAQKYVGETYKADLRLEHNGKTYEKHEKSDNLEITVSTDENVINIYYVHDARRATSVDVTRTYKTTTTTVTTGIGADGKPETTETPVTKEDKKETENYTTHPNSTDLLYATQSFTAPDKSNGYALVSDESDSETIVSLDEIGNRINLVYHRNVRIEDDIRPENDVLVKHRYITKRNYINDKGEIVTNEIVTDQTPEADFARQEGIKQGETVTISENNKTGFTRVDGNDLSFEMPGEDVEIILTYESSVDEQREETNISVKPIYVTNTKTVENGKYVINTDTDSSTAPTNYPEVDEKLYVNQFFTAPISDFVKNGFAFSSLLTTDKYEGVKLEKQNDLIELYYSKNSEQLADAKLTVTHHYKFVTKVVENGVVKDKENNSQSGPVTTDTHVGIDHTVAQLPMNGMNFESVKVDSGAYDLDTNGEVVVTAHIGETKVDIYYYGEEDRTTPATVVVNHHYKDIDLNPEVGMAESQKLGQPISSYEHTTYVATADYNGTSSLTHPYEIVKIVGTDEPTSLTKTLNAGDNVIDIYYERTIDTRTSTSVTVEHKYFILDTRTGERVQDGDTDVVNITGRENGAYVGAQFVAKEKPKADFTFHSATPSDKTIDALDVDGAKNVITIEYQKTIESEDPRVPTSVTVEHKYFLYDTRTGVREQTGDTETETLSGKKDGIYVGESFTASEKTRADFAFDKAIPSRTIASLNADGSKNVIVMEYQKNYTSVAEKATVFVNHHYKVTDLNPLVGVTTYTKNEDEVTGEIAAIFTAVVNYDGTEGGENPFVMVDVKGTDAPGALDKTLVAGKNEIDIYYERTVDTRASAQVAVEHKYFLYDTRTGNRAQVGKTEVDKLSGIDKGIYVGASFTATEKPKDEFAFHSATPSDKTIKSLDSDGAKNVITIEYQKTITSEVPKVDTQVTVEHKYFLYDTRTGTRELVGTTEKETLSGIDKGIYVGASFTATEKPKAEFKFDRATPGKTIASLDADGVKNAIVMEYEQRFTSEEERASVFVNHYYKEIDLNPLVGTKTFEKSEGEVSGEPRDVFTASADYNGTSGSENPFVIVDVQGTDGAGSMQRTLDVGANVIGIYYERTVDTRIATQVTVDHKYYVLDLKTGQRRQDGATVSESFEGIDNGIIIGASFTATEKPKEGFTFFKATPDMTISQLGATGNAITIEYQKTIGGGTDGGGDQGGGDQGGGEDGGGALPPGGDGSTYEPTEDGNIREIGEDGVPKGEWKWDEELEDWVFIPEEDVPLATMEPEAPEVPQTGNTDNMAVKMAIMTAMGLMSMGFYMAYKKKEDEQQIG